MPENIYNMISILFKTIELSKVVFDYSQCLKGFSEFQRYNRNTSNLALNNPYYTWFPLFIYTQCYPC